MLPKLCHLDNDLVIIIIIRQYRVYILILRSTHDLLIHTLPGGNFFLTVPQCVPGP